MQTPSRWSICSTCFSLAVLLILSPPTRGEQCDWDGIIGCLDPLNQTSFILSHNLLLNVGDWDAPSINKTCRATVPGVLQCLQTHRSVCSQIFFYGSALSYFIDFYINFLQHICQEPVLKGVQKHGECLNKKDLRQGTEQCFLLLSQLLITHREARVDHLVSFDLLYSILVQGIDHFCRVLIDVRICSARNVDKYCDADSVYFIDKIYQDTIISVNNIFSCEFKEPLSKYCLPSPCLNNGQCDVTADSRTVCICPQGYNGTNCENRMDGPDENSCVPNPCKNAGNCTQTTNGRVCQCRPGYEGQLCENRKECEEDTCQNGGVCNMAENDAALCTCLPLYKGDFCQLPKVCAEVLCEHQGTCLDTINGARCTCSEWYTGDLCQKIVPTPSTRIITSTSTSSSISPSTNTASPTINGNSQNCNSVTCDNGGTCEMKDSSPTCLCPTGYDGPLCQTRSEQQPATGKKKRFDIVVFIVASFGALGFLLLVMAIVTTVIYCRRPRGADAQRRRSHSRGKGSIHRDDRWSMYRDGKESMYRDGKESMYRDGKESMYRDGKGSMYRDDKESMYHDIGKESIYYVGGKESVYYESDKGPRYHDGGKGSRYHEGEKGSRYHDGGKGSRYDDGGKGSMYHDGGKGSRYHNDGKESRYHDGGKESRYQDGGKGYRYREGDDDSWMKPPWSTKMNRV